MNYDKTQIPAGYDRARDHGPENVALWMATVASYVDKRSIKTILDLGCGTGRYSAGLAGHLEADVVGVDPSSQMLDQARQKNTGRVLCVRGTAEAIPLKDSSVDLVFMSMVFHHFRDQASAAREIGRVLRSGGIAFLRAGSRERTFEYPYVEFFPSSAAIILDLLSSVESMRQTFESAGFRTVASDVVRQQVAPSYATYAEKLAAGGDSVLAQLPREEFESGVKAVRNCDRPGEVSEPIDYLVFEKK